MRVLILGGSGLISTQISQQCLDLGYEVCHFNRGQTSSSYQGLTIIGDRYNENDLQKTLKFKPDVVIDMLGFKPEDAWLIVKVFKHRVKQVIFCSTACIYNLELTNAPIKECDAKGSNWHYGKGKLECEKILQEASRSEYFATTIFRPSHICGDNFLSSQLYLDGFLYIRRIIDGHPILLADQGRALWQACHCIDAGIGIAHAIGRTCCFEKVYNLSYDEVISWKSFYQNIASLIGRELKLYTLDSQEIIAQSPTEFAFLRDITRYDFCLDSSKLYKDIAEFERTISFSDYLSSIINNIDNKKTSKVSPNLEALLEKAKLIS